MKSLKRPYEGPERRDRSCFSRLVFWTPVLACVFTFAGLLQIQSVQNDAADRRVEGGAQRCELIQANINYVSRAPGAPEPKEFERLKAECLEQLKVYREDAGMDPES